LLDKAPAIEFLKGGTAIGDTDHFEITVGGNALRFEFDSNGSVTSGVPVPFSAISTASDLAQALATAVNSVTSPAFNVSAQASGPRVRLSGTATVTTVSAGLDTVNEG
jgi:hypothetical protein